MLVTLALSVAFGVSTGSIAVSLFPGAGYDASHYGLLPKLEAALAPEQLTGDVCVAHSNDGSADLLKALNTKEADCRSGAIFLGTVPEASTVFEIAQHQPVLVVAGTLDGVSRMSEFAVGRFQFHEHFPEPANEVSYVLLDGASHHSFAGGEPTSVTKGVDLTPSKSHDEVHATLVEMVAEMLQLRNSNSKLERGKKDAATIPQPLVLALQLEGSSALGHPACNSDFPTNPTCQYPKWPDHSLPPGPAKPPAPLPPKDCVCGSPWIEKFANRMIQDFANSKIPTALVTTKDSFHDVSDTHPFHLPHIFNNCSASDSSCDLNMTTVTMPILKGGTLFPNTTNPPLSAFEMRTKLKSRQAGWEAAGLGPQDEGKTDKNMSMCRDVNQAAYDWALANADPAVVKKFIASGEPFVMVDDKPAKIGITGPEWIKDELVYTRANGKVEVQSWQFVVANTNDGKVPWFFPVGMHYCKFLSPARVMEWIYTDGLRAAIAL